MAFFRLVALVLLALVGFPPLVLLLLLRLVLVLVLVVQEEEESVLVLLRLRLPLLSAVRRLPARRLRGEELSSGRTVSHVVRPSFVLEEDERKGGDEGTTGCISGTGASEGCSPLRGVVVVVAVSRSSLPCATLSVVVVLGVEEVAVASIPAVGSSWLKVVSEMDRGVVGIVLASPFAGGEVAMVHVVFSFPITLPAAPLEDDDDDDDDAVEFDRRVAAGGSRRCL